MPDPVVFAVPADVELHPAPIPAHWITEGSPQARSKRLGTSADGTASIMAWSCTPGRFTWRYTVDEIIHIISGEIFVTDENGQQRRLGPGDMVFFRRQRQRLARDRRGKKTCRLPAQHAAPAGSCLARLEQVRRHIGRSGGSV